MVFFASCMGLFVLASIPSGPVVPGKRWFVDQRQLVGFHRSRVGPVPGSWRPGHNVAVSGRLSIRGFERRDL